MHRVEIPELPLGKCVAFDDMLVHISWGGGRMSILNFIKKQFIEVIDWVESGDGVLAYRFPMQDREVMTGAQLTVRDSQLALFVNEGRMADQFGPGLYKLSTKNLPILTDLNNWDKAFHSPFKSDVYFFSTRDQMDQKWGTPTPITVRDKSFGVTRLRAYGSYSYKIEDPKLFYAKISGTRDMYTRDDLSGQLHSVIVAELANYLGSSDVAFVDMAGNQMQFSDRLREMLAPTFTEYGLHLQSYFVQSISLPEELQSHFDKLASMNMLGDLGRYTQFQTAESISTAAANPGGLAGAGAGIGAGMAVGQAMVSAMGGSVKSAGGSPEDPTTALEKVYDLFKKGVLTQAEFDAKKAELLKKIGG
jgi:membrane protease subunit (stomatin/prohibitin family)